MDRTANAQKPLPRAIATRALARCITESGRLLAQRRTHLPKQHVGLRLHFADGTAGKVFRETVVERQTPDDPLPSGNRVQVAFPKRPLARIVSVGVHPEYTVVPWIPGAGVKALGRPRRKGAQSGLL